MSIFPLPQFEADVAELERDREVYERLKPPTSIVVRFGTMRLVGEYPYKGEQKPGCGSKLVVKTHRGIEMGEMLTSTCPNAGCSKSVSRKEMLEYIENSGGRDYPFFTEGRVLRVATVDDMNAQQRIEAQKRSMRDAAQRYADEMMLPMKFVETEPILGGERLTLYFMSEDRVDFRELASALAGEFHTRIELRQIGARDEARLTADYEKCGQHCCCKQFLKVLKPVSMKAAKTQKASLDPLKISGRCGRLMCCLRYEDETYEDLRKRLPRAKSRWGSSHGLGTVIDKQILTQLVKLRLDDGTDVAVPVEELVPESEWTPAMMAKAPDPMRGADAERRSGSRRGTRTKDEQQAAYKERAEREAPPELKTRPELRDRSAESGEGTTKKKKRRSKKRPRPGGAKDDAKGARPDGSAPKQEQRRRPARDEKASAGEATSGGSGGSGGEGTKKKRRRGKRGGRGRKKSDGGGSGGGDAGGGVWE